LKKRTKKLLLRRAMGAMPPKPKAQSKKVFLLRAGRPGFSSEKEVLPSPYRA
jgi:hypothetical protein